jgi:hypothetical protein
LAIDKKNILYTNYWITTIIITVFAILLLGCVLYQYNLFAKGLKSFNDVIFADGALSDNNQLWEIVYNKMLTADQYCY